MIAIDTNILVYAHRADLPQHAAATQAFSMLSASESPWAIPWPCVHEFIAIVTGSAFKKSATPLELALDAIDTWLSHPNCIAIHEGANYFSFLSGLAQRANTTGGVIHDARIAAICLDNNVTELWTCDRDFSQFPDLRARNPLIAALHEPLKNYR